MGKTSIEWADYSWNPVTGCHEVSEGCQNCYAKTFAERWRGTPGHYFERGFDVQLRPDKLDLPLRWRRPRRIFVNSMSDLFHDDMPDEFIARIFAVMAYSYRHTFQILTKRHGRMRSLLSSPEFVKLFDNEFCRIPDWNERWPDLEFTPFGHVDHLMDGPLSNVWLGVSAETQQWADIRIPALLDTPAAVRFISAEPLLGPISIFASSKIDREPGLDWVIAGGESGRGARPMHPDWARVLRDECQSADVAFLFKQHGEWVAESMWLHADNAPAAFLSTSGMVRHLVNGKPTAAPMSRGHDITVRRVGKHRAGRELDGQTWDQYPQEATA